jgi:hypothetical protein
MSGRRLNSTHFTTNYNLKQSIAAWANMHSITLPTPPEHRDMLLGKDSDAVGTGDYSGVHYAGDLPPPLVKRKCMELRCTKTSWAAAFIMLVVLAGACIGVGVGVAKSASSKEAAGDRDCTCSKCLCTTVTYHCTTGQCDRCTGVHIQATVVMLTKQVNAGGESTAVLSVVKAASGRGHAHMKVEAYSIIVGEYTVVTSEQPYCGCQQH